MKIDKKFQLKWWPLLVIFLFSFIRSDVIAKEAKSNLGLINFNKIYEGLLIEEEALNDGGKAAATEVLLRRLTKNNNRIVSADVSAQRALGVILIAQNRQEEALQILRQANIDPVTLIVAQGNYASSVSLYEQALSWYHKAVNIDPERKEIWHEVGMLYLSLEQTDQAIYAFQQAWAFSYANSADPLAELLRSDGRCEEAVEVWKAAVATFAEHPHRLIWWRGLSHCLRATAKWDDALEVTQKAIDEFPNDARLHVERGFALYYAAGNLSRAIAEFDQAIILDENLAMTYAALGEIFTVEEDFDKSIHWYSQAIELDSRNPSWHIARADAALSKGNFIQGLHFYERTISLWPNIPYPHYRIALVYRRMEQPEKAAESIEKAIFLSEQPNPQYFFRAATIYEWMGNNEKAIQAYQKVLTLDPSNDLAKEGIERLTD